jgi:hypothetical protein
LGLTTTTDDVTGATLAHWSGLLPTKENVAEVLSSFLGARPQKPPAFSAIKRGGQVAYKAARAGQPLDLAPRLVTALDLSLLAWEPPEAVLRLTVSSGYYVRSLARDWGQALGLGGGALKELRRERIGPFVLTKAMALPTEREELSHRLISPRQALPFLTEVLVTESEAQKLTRGQVIRSTLWNAGQAAHRRARSLGSQEVADRELDPLDRAGLSLGGPDLGDLSVDDLSVGELNIDGQDLDGQDLDRLALAAKKANVAEPSVLERHGLAPHNGLAVKIVDPQGQLLGLGQWEPRQGRGQPSGPFLRPLRVFRSPKAIG